MDLKDFFLERRKAELPAFLRVLKAIPSDQLGYKPDERSPSAGQLVWTLTWELRSCLDVVREKKAEWKNEPAPPLPEMIDLFEKWSNELIEGVTALSDDEWNQTAQFYYNGKLVSGQPVRTFLWFILFDAIHHRGQLSAYLRPMGAKVPAIYGPSADERPS